MKTFLIIILVTLFGRVLGQSYVDLDLSKKTLNEPTIGLNSSGIRLNNKLPKGDYKIKIEVEEELDGSGNTKFASDGTSTCDTSNANFIDALNNLMNETDEGEVPREVEILKEETKKITSGCESELKPKAEGAIAATMETINFGFILSRNQNIIVTITREDINGKVQRTWTCILRTPRKANYLSHFGFSFVPNGENNSNNFFSKKDTGDSYIINRFNKNGNDFWKDLSLTANFIVFPFNMKNEDAKIKVGIMGGFGISGDAKFTVFFGPSIVFNDFISINPSVGLYNQYQLKGEYSQGQRITENLNFDQLHVRGLRPSFIISLGIRLSKEQLQENIETKGGK